MAAKRVHVIVNPASGQDRPILNTLNRVFHEADIHWDVSLTRADRDTRKLAHDIAKKGEADIVAVYGGDDTLTAVAAGLIDTDTPMAILPGGTANVLALELGIPLDLAQAASLIADGSTTRCLDLGRIRDHYFSVRVSTGLLASMVVNADRGSKDQLGELAYMMRGLEAALGERKNSVYTLVIDGMTVEVEGVAGFIANSGNLSLRGVSFAQSVRVDDGLLDVLVIRRMDVSAVVSIIASAAALENIGEPLQHWQGREITVNVEPPHPVALDGEPFGQTPFTVEVVPAAVEVLVPEPVEPAGGAE